MILLLLFAFFAGLATILAPCIWPVLPIVLSSSVSGEKGHQRPLGITLGVMLSFGIFTLFVSYLVQTLHLNPNILRILAVFIIVFLGLTMVIPPLGIIFEMLVGKLSTLFGQGNKNTKHSGFLPGFITGLSLGVIWSPCAGPILATIATLAATGMVSFSVVLVTSAYVLGVGIPLFLFSYGGARIIAHTRGINKYTPRIQQGFGVIMIMTAIAIYYNYDQTLQLAIINKFPLLGTALNGFENSQLVKTQLDILKGKGLSTQETTGDNNTLFNANSPAPEFTGITKWLNTPTPISLSSLRGKVVLIDFWTYTCINCIRTLPYVTSWYDSYHNQGFVVIGVHTPEFQFEHDSGNVEKAIAMYHIHYPVAQDNNYATWNAFSNQYWPAEYLIDQSGMIRRTEFGEGNYDETDKAIRELLKEAGHSVTKNAGSLSDQTPHGTISPETYIGANRMQYYFPNGNVPAGDYTLSLQDPVTNTFSLGGHWIIGDEYAQTKENGILAYNFIASRVFLVLSPPQGGKGEIRVLLDGKQIPDGLSGSDVHKGMITVDGDRLYSLVDLHSTPQAHTLRLEFLTPGIQVFAFTFG